MSKPSLSELGVWDVGPDGELHEVKHLSPTSNAPDEYDPAPGAHHEDDAMPVTTPPQYNGNGNGNGSAWMGLPVWARIVFIFGAPTAIALGMVVNSEWNTKRELSVIHDELRNARVVLAEHDRTTDQRLNTLTSGTNETNRILLRLCVMQARSDEARQACLGK